MPSGDDKLVQSAIKILLEQIYEQVFSEHSHGFRPNKSCHTALESVQKTWTAMKWFVEFDIKGCFDNISHLKLMEILSKRISDKKFLKLIHLFLKAGYMEDWKYGHTYSGSPQGGIISPILANIYLHELDEYIKGKISNFNVGNNRPQNPEYTRLSRKIRTIRKKCNEQSSIELKNELRELTEILRKTSVGIEKTDAYKRLRYCRYADDFIVGIIGSFNDAKLMLHSITQFLNQELLLETSDDKTGIKRATRGIEFLGYGIKIRTTNKVVRTIKKGVKCKARSVSQRIFLYTPETKIREFVKKHDYGDYNKLIGSHRSYLLTSTEAEIITLYNAELRGFANYYSLAKFVKHDLSRLAYISLRSLLKTLANKRKATLRNIYKRLHRNNEYTLKYQHQDEWKELKVFQLKHLTKPTRKLMNYLSSPIFTKVAQNSLNECLQKFVSIVMNQISP